MNQEEKEERKNANDENEQKNQITTQKSDMDRKSLKLQEQRSLQ